MRHCGIALAVAIAMDLLLHPISSAAAADGSSDRLILYFRLVPPDASPERYFCAIASEVTSFNDSSNPRSGVMTDVGMRYGITEIYRAKLLSRTTSQLQPSSPADGAYVLTIDPLFTVCVRSYAMKSYRGKPAVGYVDLRDGKSYDFVLRGTRTFDVYAVEVAGGNALEDIWNEWKKSH